MSENLKEQLRGGETFVHTGTRLKGHLGQKEIDSYDVFLNGQKVARIEVATDTNIKAPFRATCKTTRHDLP